MSKQFQTEKHLRQWLMKYIPGHWQPIELSQGVGVSDLNYCIKGVEGWAELKVLPIAKDDKTPVSVDLRPTQYSWMTRRHYAQGRVCLIIGIDKSILIVKDFYIWSTLLTGSKITWKGLVDSAEGGLIPATKESIDKIQMILSTLDYDTEVFAYKEGVLAYHNEKGPKAPYPKKSRKWDSWTKGWWDAYDPNPRSKA